MARLDDRSLKTLPFFMIFVKSWSHRAYDAGIFAQLADNGLLGCTQVVAVKSRIWSHFPSICERLSALLVGWWDWSGMFSATREW